METKMGVIREIFQPKTYINRLSIKEDLSFKPLVRNISIILVLCILSAFLYSTLGVRTEEIASELSKQSKNYIETLQWIHSFGIVLKAILFPLFYLSLSTLAFHLFFREISIKMLLYSGQYYLVFILFNQIVQLFLFHYWGITAISSPFSLGVVMQIVTDIQFFINLSSYVNLFYLGGMTVIILLITEQTERRLLHTALYIIGVHLIFALIGAGLSMINIDALLL